MFDVSEPRRYFQTLRLTVTNSTNILVAEDTVFMEVSKAAGLFVEGGGKAVCVGLVVGQLRVNEVVNLYPKVQVVANEASQQITYVPLQNEDISVKRLLGSRKEWSHTAFSRVAGRPNT